MEPNRKRVKRTSRFHLGLRNEALKFMDCGINEYIQKSDAFLDITERDQPWKKEKKLTFGNSQKK